MRLASSLLTCLVLAWAPDAGRVVRRGYVRPAGTDDSTGRLMVWLADIGGFRWTLRPYDSTTMLVIDGGDDAWW